MSHRVHVLHILLKYCTFHAPGQVSRIVRTRDAVEWSSPYVSRADPGAQRYSVKP